MYTIYRLYVSQGSSHTRGTILRSIKHTASTATVNTPEYDMFYLFSDLSVQHLIPILSPSYTLFIFILNPHHKVYTQSTMTVIVWQELTAWKSRWYPLSHNAATVSLSLPLTAVNYWCSCKVSTFTVGNIHRLWAEHHLHNIVWAIGAKCKL